MNEATKLPQTLDPAPRVREPMHRPGHHASAVIQPHGAVLAALTDTWQVTHASANLGAVLGRSAEAVLGCGLSEVLGDTVVQAVRGAGPHDRAARVTGLSIPGPDGGTLHLEAYRSGPYICVDIEPGRPAAAQTQTITAAQAIIETFRYAWSRAELCRLAACGLRQLTGYDRVVVYRFAADRSLEVFAEAGPSLFESGLGLRFPSPDFLTQASRSYLQHRVGAVADAGHEPVPLIVHSALERGESLDLAQSALRSRSPAHRAYMRDMNAVASVTIGLIHAETLWGIVVCHHATPRVAAPDLRAAADLIGQVASLLLVGLGEMELLAQRRERDAILRSVLDRIADRSDSPEPLAAALAAAETELLHLMDASGAVLQLHGTVHHLGSTPPTAVAEKVLAALAAESGGEILAIEDLGQRHAAFPGWTPEASGALLLPLGPDAGDAILWFRPELARTITWAGNPAEPAAVDQPAYRLLPHASFACRTEITRGRSAPWTEVDLAIAADLRKAIAAERVLRTKAELRRQVRRQEAQNEALSRAAVALKASEDRLRFSEARLDRAQEIARIGSWEFDVASGRYIWSREMFRIRGVDPTTFEPNSDNIGDYIHPDDYTAAMRRIDDMVAGIAVPAAEMRIIRPNGQGRVVRVEGRPEVDPDGVIRRIVGTMQDITELRLIERQLAHVQKMDALGNLTGGMAHDFNNMLGVVMVNLEMVQRRVANDAMTAELCREALEGADRCADLIRRLLAFARRQSLHPEPTGVNALVHDITRLLRRTLGEHVVLSLHLDPALWPVMVDAVQLESALVNLATNARDAMPKGGRLDINTRNARLDVIYNALHPDVAAGDYVLIEVRDTGAGISPENIGRVFEPFFTTKGPGQGTGLGLSMAFGFIKQSGGHLSVYSEPGRGTIFSLYLPRSMDDKEPPAAESHMSEVAGGHEIVLVVEDNAQLRLAASRQLAELGYDPREAENADAALAILSGPGRLDLLFTDVVMPGRMDGFDLANAAQQLRPDLKILLTSGFAGTRGGELNIDGNPFFLLHKPYNRVQLARAVRTLLDKDAK